jgi:hypothetical protein
MDHPIGRGLGFSNLVVMIVFSVRWRFKFGATWADFKLGLLDLLPFLFFGFWRMGCPGNADWTVKVL